MTWSDAARQAAALARKNAWREAEKAEHHAGTLAAHVEQHGVGHVDAARAYERSAQLHEHIGTPRALHHAHAHRIFAARLMKGST